MPEKIKMFVMIGIPGSGKSTASLEFKNNYGGVIVSTDSIREELFGDRREQSKNDTVFRVAHSRITKNLKEGNNVIVDCTNITIKNRKAILNCAQGIDCEKIAIIVNTPFDIVKTQNRSRPQKAVVPEFVLDNYIKRFEIPFFEEGFDEIHFLHKPNDLKNNFDCVENALIKKMVGFDQENEHHIFQLSDHCSICAAELNKNGASEILIRAGFLHDYGKILTKTYKENGQARYLSHHNVGAYYLMSSFLSEIGYENEEDLLKCLFYINYHMYPFSWNQESHANKWKEIFGEENFRDLILFNKCDIIASGTGRE